MASSAEEAPLDAIIVGGGLSGLTAAYTLTKQDEYRRVLVLEARNRFGGRTTNTATGPHDLGGAWCWPTANPHLVALAKQLGVRTFDQPGDGGDDLHASASGRVQRVRGAERFSQWRFDGGAVHLCEKMTQHLQSLPSAQLQHSTEVRQIDAVTDGSAVRVSATVDGRSVTYIATSVIVAVPPLIAAQRLRFEPPLPKGRVNVMLQTPTWMSDTGKVVVSYNKPFWRAAGLSGNAYSQRGPLSQIYDASDSEGKHPALCGFLLGHSARVFRRAAASDAQVRDAVLKQLVTLFGEEAASPVQVDRLVWLDEPFTTANPDTPARPGHPHPHAALSSKHHPRVFWAGAESARSQCGLLDGAVEAGRRAAAEVAALLGK